MAIARPSARPRFTMPCRRWLKSCTP